MGTLRVVVALCVAGCAFTPVHHALALIPHALYASSARAATTCLPVVAPTVHAVLSRVTASAPPLTPARRAAAP
eukprot:1370117-Pleurochrysis_carterae.AAC.1